VLPLASPDWSRELPRPLKIPTIATLRTLGDIRALLGHLPADRRAQSTWRHVADRLHHAARGGDVNEAVTSLRLVGCPACRNNTVMNTIDQIGILIVIVLLVWLLLSK